jgi:hypothetical protein
MVGVCVSKNCAFDRLPRVDVKITLPAIKSACGECYQSLSRHGFILHYAEKRFDKRLTLAQILLAKQALIAAGRRARQKIE